MQRLPLYPDTRAVVEKTTPISARNENCKRCKMHEGVRSVCLPADAIGIPKGYTGGALLVIGDPPTQEEDAARRPMSSGANGQLRELLEKDWDGPIVYAASLRCAPGTRNPTDKIMAQCRPYTLGLIEEVKPARILCFGKRAYQMVLGSTCDPIQLSRRGYGYLSDGTPVFMFSGARRVVTNRFLWKRFRKDVEWSLTATPDLPPWDGIIYEVQTVADSVAACAALRASGRVTYDTETGGLMGGDYFQIVCLTATGADNLDDSWLWGEDALKDPAIVAPLRELLMDPEVGLVGQNLKFDVEAAGYGLNLRDDRGVLLVRGLAGDPMLAVKTIDTESKGALDHTDHHVGMGGHKAENAGALAAAKELIGRTRADPRQHRLAGMTHPALASAVEHKDVDAAAFAYALIPRDVLYRYCALDTVSTARLDAHYTPIMDSKPHLSLVRDELHIPPTGAVAQIEAWGMSADIEAARMFGRALTPVKEKALAQIRSNGCTIDVGSPAQLARYLYEDLNLPVLALTKKGNNPSTAAWVLEQLRDKHPVIAPLLEHAKVAKLLSTYVTGLIPHIRPDGRIRSNLNIGGARSGRMSSSNPNLQNIPSGGAWAKMAKSIFNVPPGHVLLQLDYSQLEVRIAAMLSQDPDLIQVYLDGVDVHRRTASRAFNVPEAKVTKALRSNAKAVVFGVLFGKTAVSLSKDLNCSIDKAQEIYDAVLGSYGVLHRWTKDQTALCERQGVTWTFVPDDQGNLQRARCRQLWQVADPNSKSQSTARNGSVNTPIQGTASDFMLRTLVKVVDWIIEDDVPARVTNTVHDSILLEVPFAQALEVAARVKAIMEGWPSAGVPLVADVDVGLSWGGLHKLEGITLVGAGRRNGLSDQDIITTVQGDKDLAEEMGSDPTAWLKKVDYLVNAVGA